eukprot:248806_1
MYSCCTTIFSMISQILMGTQTKSVVTATNYISNHSIQCCYLGCYAKEKKMKHTQRKGYSGENTSDSLECFNEFNCTYDEHHKEHEAEHIPDGVYIVLYCGFVLFIGVILKYVQHRFHLPLPYT